MHCSLRLLLLLLLQLRLLLRLRLRLRDFLLVWLEFFGILRFGET